MAENQPRTKNPLHSCTSNKGPPLTRGEVLLPTVETTPVRTLKPAAPTSRTQVVVYDHPLSGNTQSLGPGTIDRALNVVQDERQKHNIE